MPATPLLFVPPSVCCGGAVEHSVGRPRHTGQISCVDQLERVLSAAVGLDRRLRGFNKSVKAQEQSDIGGRKGHQLTLTRK